MKVNFWLFTWGCRKSRSWESPIYRKDFQRSMMAPKNDLCPFHDLSSRRHRGDATANMSEVHSILLELIIDLFISCFTLCFQTLSAQVARVRFTILHEPNLQFHSIMVHIKIYTATTTTNQILKIPKHGTQYFLYIIIVYS